MKRFLSPASDIALRFWTTVGRAAFIILTIVLAPLWYPLHLFDRWLRKGKETAGKKSLLDILRRKRKLTILLAISIIAVVAGAVIGLLVTGGSPGFTKGKAMQLVGEHIRALALTEEECELACCERYYTYCDLHPCLPDIRPELPPGKYRFWPCLIGANPITAEQRQYFCSGQCKQDCLSNRLSDFYSQAERKSPHIWHVRVFEGAPHSGTEIGIWWVDEDTGEVGAHNTSAKDFESSMDYWWYPYSIFYAH